MIDFPASPLTGQVFAPGNGTVYQWDGVVWLPRAQTGAGGGDFCAVAPSGISTVAATPLIFPTVSSGNLGGWYSTSTGRWTPPAGRYCIYCHVSVLPAGLGTNTLTIRKNGTAITPNTFNFAPAGASQSAVLSESLNVDANGTDYFDVAMAGATGAATNSATFGAFPIPAAGTTSVPSTSWRQLARVVPTAGQASVDFQNIPVDINDLKCTLDLSPTTNDQDLYVQFYDNVGVLDTTSAHYAWSNSNTNNGATIGAAPASSSSNAVSVTTAIVLDYSQTNNRIANLATNTTSGWRGDFTIPNIRDTGRGKSIVYRGSYVNGANTLELTVVGGGRRLVVGAITGYRLVFSASTFAAGGAVTLWGSP